MSKKEIKRIKKDHFLESLKMERLSRINEAHEEIYLFVKDAVDFINEKIGLSDFLRIKYSYAIGRFNHPRFEVFDKFGRIFFAIETNPVLSYPVIVLSGRIERRDGEWRKTSPETKECNDFESMRDTVIDFLNCCVDF